MRSNLFIKHGFRPFRFIGTIYLADAWINVVWTRARFLIQIKTRFWVAVSCETTPKCAAKFFAEHSTNLKSSPNCHFLQTGINCRRFSSSFSTIMLITIEGQIIQTDAQLAANPLPSTNSLSSVLYYACHIPCRVVRSKQVWLWKKFAPFAKGRKSNTKDRVVVRLSQQLPFQNTQLPLRVILAQQLCAGMVEQAHTHRHLRVVRVRKSTLIVISGNVCSIKSSILAARLKLDTLAGTIVASLETQILNYRRRRWYLIEEVKV